jgi:hypothetical protein
VLHCAGFLHVTVVGGDETIIQGKTTAVIAVLLMLCCVSLCEAAYVRRRRRLYSLLYRFKCRQPLSVRNNLPQNLLMHYTLHVWYTD